MTTPIRMHVNLSLSLSLFRSSVKLFDFQSNYSQLMFHQVIAICTLFHSCFIAPHLLNEREWVRSGHFSEHLLNEEICSKMHAMIFFKKIIFFVKKVFFPRCCSKTLTTTKIIYLPRGELSFLELHSETMGNELHFSWWLQIFFINGHLWKNLPLSYQLLFLSFLI